MADLTPEEQQELSALRQQQGDLTPEEAQELASLRAEQGNVSGGGMFDDVSQMSPEERGAKIAAIDVKNAPLKREIAKKDFYLSPAAQIATGVTEAGAEIMGSTLGAAAGASMGGYPVIATLPLGSELGRIAGREVTRGVTRPDATLAGKDESILKQLEGDKTQMKIEAHLAAILPIAKTASGVYNWATRKGFSATPEAEVMRNMLVRKGAQIPEGTLGDDAISTMKAQQKIIDESLPNQIAAELSTGTAADKVPIARLAEDTPVLDRMGFFNKVSRVDEIPKVVTTELQNNVENMAKVTSDLDTAAAQTGRGLTGADLVDEVATLGQRVKALKLTSLTSGKADAMVETQQQLLNDINMMVNRDANGKLIGAKPSQVVQFIRNLNEWRRTVVKEFSLRNLKAKASGDTPSMQQVDASVEAATKIQAGLTRQLDEIVKDLNAAKNTGHPDNIISSLNEEYSALKSVEMAAKNKAVLLQQKLSPEVIPQQVQGPEGLLSNIWKMGPRRGIANWATQRSGIDRVSESISRNAVAQENPLLNIRDAISLSKNPINPPSKVILPNQLVGQGAALGSLAANSPLAQAVSPAEAQAQELPLPLQQMMGVQQEVDPFANGLPRDTAAFNEDALARYLMGTAADPARAVVAQGLAKKFTESLLSGDKHQQRQLLESMSKIAPHLFEPGMGIDNTLSFKEDQEKYMALLQDANKNGKIDSIHLAKQQEAFSKPHDAKILEIQHPVAEIMNQRRSPANKLQPRLYSY